MMSSGLHYTTQHHGSQLNSYFRTHSNRVRELQASALKATVINDALPSVQWDAPVDAISLKVANSPYCGYQEDAFVAPNSPLLGYQEDAVVSSVSVKVTKVPAPSPATSFKLHTAKDAPALQLLLSPPCIVVAGEESGAVVDVAPCTSVTCETKSVSMPTADELLGGGAPMLSCQTGTAAYSSECQRLAWAQGQLMTWAAAALSGEQQQAQQECIAAPAGPIALDARWNFMFTCLEAAAKVGMCATYSMAVADVC